MIRDILLNLAELAGTVFIVACIMVIAVAATPCDYEDEANCRWTAESSGNGQGTSFIDVAGYRIVTGEK